MGPSTTRQSAKQAGTVVLAVRVALVGSALALALLPLPRPFVESVYARRLYPLIRQLVTSVTRHVDVALFDLLLSGGLLVISAWWAVRMLRVPRGGRVRELARLAGLTVVVAAALYLMFLATWGLNYRREALATRLGYSDTRVNAGEVEALAASAIRELNRAYDESEHATWPQLSDLPSSLGQAFERTQRHLGVFPVMSGLVPQRSLLTPYFRRAGIDGMVDPFFLQVLVNDGVLPFERPFVTAHEWAHVAGFAHEAEANFVAWVTCLQGDERMRYSGWSFLVPRLVAALPPDRQPGLWETVGPGAIADFAAVRARLNRTIPVVRRTARRLNDQYLRANRVASGIASRTNGNRQDGTDKGGKHQL
ncbi:MAG TPA: DUF3810 family protein, partial [Acidobacteria bacterium]|nr:DUF3810 family protein [Acidobacteriota bacterium]